MASSSFQMAPNDLKPETLLLIFTAVDNEKYGSGNNSERAPESRIAHFGWPLGAYRP